MPSDDDGHTTWRRPTSSAVPRLDCDWNSLPWATRKVIQGAVFNACLHLALIDPDDLVEHVERLLARALEGVAADDRTVGPAIAQAADLGEQAFEVLGLAAREHHD